MLDSNYIKNVCVFYVAKVDLLAQLHIFSVNYLLNKVFKSNFLQK